MGVFNKGLRSYWVKEFILFCGSPHLRAWCLVSLKLWFVCFGSKCCWEWGCAQKCWMFLEPRYLPLWSIFIVLLLQLADTFEDAGFSLLTFTCSHSIQIFDFLEIANISLLSFLPAFIFSLLRLYNFSLLAGSSLLYLFSLNKWTSMFHFFVFSALGLLCFLSFLIIWHLLDVGVKQIV